MYLVDFDIFIKQILPPHWRTGFKVRVLKTLLYPMKAIYNSFIAFQKMKETQVNINGQKIVFERHLKSITNQKSYVIDKKRHIDIVLFGATDEQIEEVKKQTDKYLFYNYTYKIINY